MTPEQKAVIDALEPGACVRGQRSLNGFRVCRHCGGEEPTLRELVAGYRSVFSDRKRAAEVVYGLWAGDGTEYADLAAADRVTLETAVEHLLDGPR